MHPLSSSQSDEGYAVPFAGWIELYDESRATFTDSRIVDAAQYNTKLYITKEKKSEHTSSNVRQ